MILDTCALIWLAENSRNISRETLLMIKEAPSIHISAITCFEIALKHKVGKLKLPVPPKPWLELVLEHHDISIIEISGDIALLSAELPPYHKDPCDRFIIATAKMLNMPVVTADQNFKHYGIKTVI